MYTPSRYASGPGYEVDWFTVHAIEKVIIDIIRVGAFYTYFCLNGLRHWPTTPSASDSRKLRLQVIYFEMKTSYIDGLIR